MRRLRFDDKGHYALASNRIRLKRRMNNDRVKKAMARDTPEYKIVYVSMHDLITRDEFDTKQFALDMLHPWAERMEIKLRGLPRHMWDVDSFTEYDIDFMRYRFGVRVRYLVRTREEQNIIYTWEQRRRGYFY